MVYSTLQVIEVHLTLASCLISTVTFIFVQLLIMTSVTLSLKPFIDRISETDLEKLCQENPEARLETNPEGQLIIMSPTGRLN